MSKHFSEVIELKKINKNQERIGPETGVGTEKLVFACLWWLVLITHWFLGLYLGAIGTGLPRAFRNGMTIGITPKNEVLRVKSLKQPILQEIKESSKFGNYGPP